MTTTYTFEQLKEDVKKEAQALRVHATQEERERLSMESFSPSFAENCIYGLLTGKCWSPRAAELIELCAIRYFNPDAVNKTLECGIDGIVQTVDGSTVKDFISIRTMHISKAPFSAIEVYILLPDANDANLIAYLKGETDTIDL